MSIVASGFGFTLLIVTLLVTGATHYLYGGIRLQGRNNRVSSSAQVQISIIVGIFMLLKAVSYWLDRYGLAISSGHLFTGISYTDAHAVLPAKKAVRYMQIENKIRAIVRYELASAIPLAY